MCTRRGKQLERRNQISGPTTPHGIQHKRSNDAFVSVSLLQNGCGWLHPHIPLSKISKWRPGADAGPCTQGPINCCTKHQFLECVLAKMLMSGHFRKVSQSVEADLIPRDLQLVDGQNRYAGQFRGASTSSAVHHLAFYSHRSIHALTEHPTVAEPGAQSDFQKLSQRRCNQVVRSSPAQGAPTLPAKQDTKNPQIPSPRKPHTFARRRRGGTTQVINKRAIPSRPSSAIPLQTNERLPFRENFLVGH